MSRCETCATCGKPLLLLGERLRGTCNGCDMLLSGRPPAAGSGPSDYPKKLLSVSALPGDVAELAARNRRHGVRAAYDAEGNCWVADKAAHRDVLALEAKVRKDGTCEG